MLPCAGLHCSVMCVVLHCRIIQLFLILCCVPLCCVALSRLTALHCMLCLTPHIMASHNNNIICSVALCYVALNCVALCSVQGQTQQSFRIILMPWLLPGNSCPGTEMNGCPWALSLSSSSLPSSFFSFSVSLTHTDYVDCKCSITF